MINAKNYFFLSAIESHILAEVETSQGISTMSFLSLAPGNEDKFMIVRAYCLGGEYFIDYSCKVCNNGNQLIQARSQALPGAAISGIVAILVNDFFSFKA